MLVVVDAREEHVLLGAVLIGLLGTEFLVAVGLVGTGLHLRGILHGTLLGGGLHCALSGLPVHDIAVERAAIQQRGLTILLTAQILRQREGVVGRVLVKGRILRTANQNQRIATETDENHHYTRHDVGKHAHGDANTELEQINAQCDEQHQGNQQAVTEEQHARQQNAKGERNLDAQVALVVVQLPQGPCQNSKQHDGINQNAGVERHAQRVDEEQVELLAHLHETRLQTVQNQAHNDKRNQQRNQRTLSR